MSDSGEPDFPTKGQFLVYTAEDGRMKIDVRLENETVWLTQKLMAELFQATTANINIHLKNIFADGELTENSVIKESLITAADGKTYRTAKELAEGEYDKFHRKQIRIADRAGGDFDRAVRQLAPPVKVKKKREKK